MAKLLRMPEISANATEAVLQEWSVQENTPFAADDTIATIETDKAAVDTEAEADGVIIKMLVAAGAAVEVGSPIALLGDPTETITDLDALLAELGVSATVPSKVEERRDVPDNTAPADGEPTNGEAMRYATAPAEAPLRPEVEDRGDRVFASPLARRLAKDAGIPVTEIPGTGPGGRITRSDVEAVVSERAVRPTPSAPAAPPSAPPKVGIPEATPAPSAAAKVAGFTDIPHSRIRRAVAQRLTESKQSIPHFYLQGSAQVDKLLKLRSELNAAGGAKISVNDMVIKAAAHAYKIIPAMNVIWTADATRQFDHVDMSVAIATERGLVTPVLRSVEQLSIGTVATTVKDFVERAREGKLRQNELEGGAFSITNLGMFGVEDFSAIINPPQSAILAVGAARQEPIVRDGELTVGTVMKFTLSVDHRAIDGALAAEWLRAFVAVLSDPIQVLL